MNYQKDERIEVIRQAYSGLFKLASHGLFDKYVDFIDVYAQVSEQEQENLYNEIIQHEETIMLAQYIREKGVQQGVQQGIQQGVQQGIQQGVQQGIIKKAKEDVIEALELRFGEISSEIIDQINQTNDPSKLKEFHKQAIQISDLDSFGLIC